MTPSTPLKKALALTYLHTGAVNWATLCYLILSILAMFTTNVDLFVAQTRLRDQVIDAWLPSADRQGLSDLALYLVSRAKSDLLPMRLYTHQEEMDRLDEVIAMEEWEAIWGFQYTNQPGATV